MVFSSHVLSQSVRRRVKLFRTCCAFEFGPERYRTRRKDPARNYGFQLQFGSSLQGFASPCIQPGCDGSAWKMNPNHERRFALNARRPCPHEKAALKLKISVAIRFSS